MTKPARKVIRQPTRGEITQVTADQELTLLIDTLASAELIRLFRDSSKATLSTIIQALQLATSLAEYEYRSKSDR